jgi:hypothetical protein
VKLFIIVDHYLDRTQQGIQGIHAALQFALDCPALLDQHRNTNIVLKKAKDMDHWSQQGDATFREPHWDFRITAVAAYRNEDFAEELPLV